ncbi:SDR family NAD(P)-dependent oxidoreductase [Pseudonocardia charpentierae]|uniref:SDR family oxidoreductase n=1 Tax=Pseudonocardia charpentierae TaxID=3075545 RepID=A0ABU2NJ96_9PSEU|nr:SDR family oxidoreductase [Pseudonocardia sp. DSM 45834]MDT0353093.1 SDR family oxidoreductase [Pseudonocardia sp. DSM 45834]
MTAPTGPLHERVVVVTGGSRGIGAAVVRTAHRDGATVVLHYGSADAVARAVADELGGERSHLVRGDLAEPSGPDATWSAALDAAGRVDVLVNNAGAWIASPVHDRPAWSTGWQRNLTLNLTAPAELCRLAIQHFRAAGGGSSSNSPAGRVGTDLAAGELDPALVASLPLREVTPPQDVAEVIAFLASGRARHTTGATIDITGADYVR